MKENPNVRSDSVECAFERVSDTVILISLAVKHALFSSTFSLSVNFLHFTELDIKWKWLSTWYGETLESSPAVQPAWCFTQGLAESRTETCLLTTVWIPHNMMTRELSWHVENVGSNGSKDNWHEHR